MFSKSAIAITAGGGTVITAVGDIAITAARGIATIAGMGTDIGRTVIMAMRQGSILADLDSADIITITITVTIDA